MQPGALLEIAEDAEQVSSLRVPPWPEHTDQAFWLCPGCLAEFLKADRRFDVVAQNDLAGFDIARQHRLDAFAQQRFGKSFVGRDLLLHQLLEASRASHHPSPVLIRRMARLRCL